MPQKKGKETKEKQIAEQEINPATGQAEDSLRLRLDHYHSAQEDMDVRRTRKNGWNDIYKAYLGVLPSKWPYQAKVTDPRIKTSINEKTGRLLNARLRGHLIPREGGDTVGAKIHNAILETQWDTATLGGTMLEKVAKTDTQTRLIGLGIHFNYWNDEENTNESKPCDPRDILFDPSADHIHNARWVQYREYVTVQDLKDRGYDVSNIEFGKTKTRASNYDSIVKETRHLEDKVGLDRANPVVELITEWVPKWATADREGKKYVFLPDYEEMLEDGPNPYKHGLVPFSQLRYYPIHDDIYGESEVEPVLPLQRAINAILCGYLDEMNIAMRPPVKVLSGAARLDTIVYGPGAVWILNSPNAVEEANVGGNSIAAFNNTYPSLIAAFNNAMGDQSLGLSNQVVGAGFKSKTATEVRQNQQQQFTRDQYNQLYLSEFLKDIMMQWMENNKQFLFDDESKHVHIMKIIGRDAVQDLKQLGLDEAEVPPEIAEELGTIIANAEQPLTADEIEDMYTELAIPENVVIMNPEEEDPEKLLVQSKLKILGNGEAELALEKSDLEGSYDYIPDVKSMAVGATMMQEASRRQAMEMSMNPTVIQMLEKEGKRLNFSELLVNVLEDSGMRDAESLIEDITPNEQTPGAGAGVQPPGAGSLGAGQAPVGADQLAGVPGLENMADPAVAAGVPEQAGGF